MKIVPQAPNETKGTDTDKLIACLESKAQVDLLKARKGSMRSWDHQLPADRVSVMERSAVFHSRPATPLPNDLEGRKKILWL